MFFFFFISVMLCRIGEFESLWIIGHNNFTKIPPLTPKHQGSLNTYFYLKWKLFFGHNYWQYLRLYIYIYIYGYSYLETQNVVKKYG